MEQDLMEAEAKMMVAAVEEENRRLRNELAKLRSLADDESNAFKSHIELLENQLNNHKERARLAMMQAILEWKMRAAGQMSAAQRKMIGSWGCERWRYNAIIQRLERENRDLRALPPPREEVYLPTPRQYDDYRKHLLALGLRILDGLIPYAKAKP